MKIKTIVLSLVACCLSFITIENASAFSIHHDFTVFIGPFNASQTNFEYGLTDKDYFIKSNVKTAGTFNAIYPFKAIYSTTGKIEKNCLETTSYKYTSQSRFTKRTKELVYDKDGHPVLAITSKNDKEKKKAITISTNNKDTTDLQTVFAELAKHYNKYKFCDSKMEVFDGKRRFNVIFKDEGVEDLKKNEYCPYEGRANKCSMYIDKLAETGDDLMWQTTSEKPIYFWILEDKQTKHPFIAKIEVDETPLGKLKAYTKKITVKE